MIYLFIDMKKEVKIYSFYDKNNNKELLEVILKDTGSIFYIENTYSLKVDKKGPIKYEGLFNTETQEISNIKESKESYLSKEEVKSAIKEMSNDFPNIFDGDFK